MRVRQTPAQVERGERFSTPLTPAMRRRESLMDTLRRSVCAAPQANVRLCPAELGCKRRLLAVIYLPDAEALHWLFLKG